MEIAVLGWTVPVAIQISRDSIIKKYQEKKMPDKLVKELEASTEELIHSIEFFKSLQQVAGNRGDENEDSPLQNWLKKLKELLYSAEDLLDEYATNIAIREIEKETRKRKTKVSEIFMNLSYFLHAGRSEAVELAKNIRGIAADLKAHSETASSLGLIQVVNDESQRDWKWRETTPSVKIDTLVGRRDVREKTKQAILQGCGLDIEGKVVNRTQKGTLAIVPIVGMGGMGKTTLAQTIVNDEEIFCRFPWRVWVCVSDNFEVSSILQKIITSIYCLQGKNEECGWSTSRDLERVLVELVQGKRILLVLDDIWEDRKSEWEPLMEILDAAARSMEGFAVLITTRIVGIKEAILHPGCMEPVHLKGLEEEEIWQVFKEYAFWDSGGSLRDSLEVIGKEIVKRMKGLPLAAKSVGTLLSSHPSTVHWNRVADSELWELEQDRYDIIPLLRLSYEYLPTDLKQRLVFFSLYPKDYEFCEYDLIHLWMAHNLLIQHEEPEEVGKRNLKKLASWSFLEQGRSNRCEKHHILPVDNKMQCDGKRYLVHDLIHDLLQLVSKHDCHLIHDGNTKKQIPPGVQHVSVVLSRSYDPKEREQIVQCVYEHIMKHDKLRTLMISGFECDANIVEHITTRMTRLRVLALEICSGKSVPESICNLKHLRVLEVRGSITNLPESIWRLQNLQVLEPCSGLDHLSSTFTRLVNLRYPWPAPAVAGIGKQQQAAHHVTPCNQPLLPRGIAN